MNKFINKFDNQQIQVGETFALSGAQDRQQQIEQTLERLKKDRIKKAQVECQRMLDDARNEAQQLIRLAQQKADEWVQTAENQCDDIRTKAYQEGETAGYQQGYEEGLRQAEQETIRLLESAQNLVEAAYQAKKQALKQFKPDAVHLVDYLTRRILKHELSLSPKVVAQMVDQAIDDLHLSGKIRVVVSTEMLKILKNYSNQTSETLDQLTRFDLQTDPMLDTYEVYVVSDQGHFILSPDQQLDNLITGVKDHLDLPAVLSTDESTDDREEGEKSP